MGLIDVKNAPVFQDTNHKTDYRLMYISDTMKPYMSTGYGNGIYYLPPDGFKFVTAVVKVQNQEAPYLIDLNGISLATSSAEPYYPTVAQATVDLVVNYQFSVRNKSTKNNMVALFYELLKSNGIYIYLHYLVPKDEVPQMISIYGHESSVPPIPVVRDYQAPRNR